jgi:uncharacterized membrane protein
VKVDIDNQANLDISSTLNYFGEATVDIRATDGTNVGTTSFDIIIENVNDKPEAELLSPRANALIFTDTIEITWKGTDVDPGDEANLTYDIYLDSTSGTSLYKDNHDGTSLEISGLTDKSVYYWKVIPSDGTEEGICISDPCPTHFTVDLGEKAHSMLKLPGDEAVTNQDYVVLIWTGYVDEDYTISYDVYISSSALELPYPESTMIEQGTTETNLLVENLTSGETYYWTVIPRTAKGPGTCDSGVWTFKYDPDLIPYKLVIEAPEELIIEQGEEAKIPIRIRNTGANPDIVVPYLEARELKFDVVLEGTGFEHSLGKDQTLLLLLNISAEKIPMGTYDLTITAESIGGLDSETKTISLRITEKEVKEQGMDLASASFIIIPIIVIIIIAIVLFMMFRKKRIDEEKKRVEADLLKPVGVGAMVEAPDVQYFPGSAPGAVVPAQLPQVSAPGTAYGQQPYPGAPAGAQAPYTGAPAFPQLPPAAPGAVQAAQHPTPQPQVQPTAYPQGTQVQQPTPAPAPQPQAYPPAGTPATEPLQWKAPTQEPQVQVPQVQVPQQPSVNGHGVKAGTGSPPIQVPYIPRPREEEPEAPKSEDPGTVQEVVVGPEPSAMELMEAIKNKFFSGEVSEDTYMSLKKELKDVMQKEAQPGAPPAQIDNVVKRFIRGEISENEYKRQRNL